MALVPLGAILIVLAPYLWPPDRAPTSYFSDIHKQHGPNLKLLADGVHRHGELPRWNPQDFAGVPLVGDPQAGVYNPAYWLLLLRPRLHSMGLMIVAYTLSGALGFMLYARTLALSPVAASAGAVAFTLGGKLLLLLVLPGHTVMAPFFLVPLVLWSMQRAVDDPRRRRVAVVAMLVAFLAVSLHPQLLVYTACILLSVGVAMLRRAPRPWPALAALAGAGALALALAAIHVVPFFELAGEFSRFHGQFFDVTRWDAVHVRTHARWAQLIRGTAASWEAHYYFGGVTVWLTVVGILAWPRHDKRRATVWLHGLLGLVVLLYGLGPDGGLEPVLARLPGLAHTRIPARAHVVLALPVAVLLALGTDAIVRAPPRRFRFAAVFGGGLAVLLLLIAASDATHFGVLALAVAGASALHLSTRSLMHADDAPSFYEGEVVGRLAHVGAFVLIGMLAVDTGRAVAPWVRVAPEAQSHQLAPGLTVPDDVSDETRIVEIGRDLGAPGISLLAARAHRLETLAGYNPMLPWRFVLYAAYASGYNPFRHSLGEAVPFLRERGQLYDLLGVTHFLRSTVGASGTRWQWERNPAALPRAYLVPGPLVVPEHRGDQGLRAEVHALLRVGRLDPHRVVLLHGDGAGSILRAAGIRPGVELEPFRAVRGLERSPNRLVVTLATERPAVLVLNEAFFRGWRAWNNDVEIPIMRANTLFRALALPVGDHRIVLEFAPRSWRVGWWVSVAAVLVSIALCMPAPRA
jgi:hypothetical protein